MHIRKACISTEAKKQKKGMKNLQVAKDDPDLLLQSTRGAHVDKHTPGPARTEERSSSST